MNPFKVSLEWKIVGLVAPNKNGRPSCKNLDMMIGVTNPQLPKYVARAITFV
jgi:hypothetical protein